MLSVAKADGAAAPDAKGDAKLDKAKPCLAVGIGHGFSDLKKTLRSHENPMKHPSKSHGNWDFIGILLGFYWDFHGFLWDVTLRYTEPLKNNDFITLRCR